MSDRSQQSRGVGLEAGLGLALVVLILQLLPGAFSTALQWMDVRTWSHRSWTVFNAVVVVYLLHLRNPSILGNLLRSLGRPRAARSVPTEHQPDSEESTAERERQAEWVRRARNRMPWS